MGCVPTPPLNDPENGPPRGGVDVVQDGAASVRYQLVTRARAKFYLVIRCWENGDIGVSYHTVSTLDPCMVPRPIQRHIAKSKGRIGDI